MSVAAYQMQSNSEPRDTPLLLPGKETLLLESSQESRGVLCSLCGNVISKPENKFAINGQDRFSFTNPGGIQFEIVCYSQAPGCVVSTESALANTWFPGFSWSIARCSECKLHLGWMYHSSANSFYGLILNRIIEWVNCSISGFPCTHCRKARKKFF